MSNESNTLSPEDEILCRQEAAKAIRRASVSFRKASLDFDDALSSAYEGLLYGINSYDPDRGYYRGVWLRIIVRQTIYKHLNEQLAAIGQPASDDYDVEALVSEEDVEHDVLMTAEHAAVRETLLRLTEEDDDVSILFMRIFGPMTFHELQDVTGKSYGATYRAVQRGTQKLAEALQVAEWR